MFCHYFLEAGVGADAVKGKDAFQRKNIEKIWILAILQILQQISGKTHYSFQELD
jgi:hypothetical protein